MTTRLHALSNLGQSIWYDNISRALLDSGELQELIDAGVTGVTSNPSIFEKAVAGSVDYDDDIRRLAASNLTAEGLYESLAFQDIRRAADLLRPVYEATGAVDGYVSLEVSPALAHDTAGTIAAARRLFAALDRPNVMIKVPATPAGIPAVAALIGDGININVTLIFSLAHYEAVAEAYISGLERLAQRGGDLRRVASVASFFISRLDAAVDPLLAARDNSSLQGQIGLANAQVAYARFREIFGFKRSAKAGRWNRLAALGASVQRPLWASTGIKNLRYRDTLYVDRLIGPNTVNTVPPATLDAFRDHGNVSPTLTYSVAQARTRLAQLEALGIDLNLITQQLQDDGVAAFATSFHALLDSVAAKRLNLTAGRDATPARLNANHARLLFE